MFMCILTILQISVFKEGQVRLQAWIFFPFNHMMYYANWTPLDHICIIFFSKFQFSLWKLYIANSLTYIALDWTAASAKYYSNLCCESVTIFLFFIFCSLYHIYTYYCNWNVSSIILICIIGFNFNYIV